MDNSIIIEKNISHIKVDKNLIDIVNSLLDSLGEKDEKIRNTIESSLIRVAKKRYDEIVDVFCEYRKKHQKLGETQVATILRVIEYIAFNLADKIQPSTATKCIDLSITEITRSPDQCQPIQRPCQDILVSIGRYYCKDVMEALTKHLEQNQISHFMIMNAMGALATANVAEMAIFIKPTLGLILPTLSMIKQDFVKQSYAFAIGRFCESFSEYKTNRDCEEAEENTSYDISTEISIIYDTFLNSWLLIRDIKVSSDVLNALSFMYPLLPLEKINDQISKVIPLILAQYRRSIDRMAVTQLLASVIKTALAINENIIDSQADAIISSMFDLVCVNPDYEKPQTIKGHYEVLRCFDLLSGRFSGKIIDILLPHLRSTNERERIKSLLVITHLTNTADHLVTLKLDEIVAIMKNMISGEKSIKIKMVLLKTIVAFIQRNFIHDKDFIKFLIRHCCKLNKINSEQGTSEEHQDFVKACNNTLFILSSTVGTVDDILKIELLQCFVKLEYTDICSTIAKCLGNLFSKNPDLPTIPEPSEDEEKEEIPDSNTIFVRCIILLGGFGEKQRTTNLLNFLKSYCPNLYKQLIPLWNVKIPAMLEEFNSESVTKEKSDDLVFDFLLATIKDVDDVKFAEDLVEKITLQIPLYNPISHTSELKIEFRVPSMELEKGMLIKLIGICLCYVRQEKMVIEKIDMIITMSKNEKLEKNAPNENYEDLLKDYAKALGFVSCQNLALLMKKLLTFIVDDATVKKSGSFFSHLNFIKDTNKEIEIYKMKILVILTLNSIIDNAPKEQIVQLYDEKVMDYLTNQLTENKEVFIKKIVLSTILNMTGIFAISTKEYQTSFKNINELLKLIIKITNENQHENLPLFPIILRVSTELLKLSQDETIETNDLLYTTSHYFFTMAQNLKSKFDTIEEDETNSYLAKYLNASLPELNLFIKAVLELQNASIACLDDVNSILEVWLKDKNDEVRICAGHVYNNTLEVYMKTMKIGCEAPSKFNQTGNLLGEIVPRCIDSNATVRQTSIKILKRILEIACIYETLTIADSKVEWVNELEKLYENIITDDPKEIYKIAGELARIIATRLSNYQYVHFSKCLLDSLNDPEQSSAIGASVVLKFFMQIKGAEMFHAIPELIKKCLHAVKSCEIGRAKSGVLKSMLALTKHHPKLVCNEILGQSLPLEEHVIDYWRIITLDPELTGIIIDNFVSTVTTSCLYEQSHQDRKDEAKAVTNPPFAIICVFGELFKCQDIRSEFKTRFTELFCMLLTTLATYINLLPPCGPTTNPSEATPVAKNNKKNKFFAPKAGSKMKPCHIILDAFKTFLDTLKMQQIANVLNICPDLADSTNLNSFIEILTPLSVATASEVGINSSSMKQIVTTLSKYISSPYDTQRIASTGFYAHLVPLKPYGEISSVIMLHLNSSLNDPNPLVRGLSIRGMSFLCSLTEHDIEKYSEMCLTALLKGIDDYNKFCFINIPLESMKGLSKILQTLPQDKFEMFQVSLAIRIRPFFENTSTELRESAILLFGNLCNQKALNSSSKTDSNGYGTEISEPLVEQLHANLFSLLLHLSEDDNTMINRAAKITLKNVCALLNAPNVNALAQNHLLEYGQLNYSIFIKEFVKLIGEELGDSVPDFINSCLPFLRSQWPEIRGNATILIGLLHHQNKSNQHLENFGHKISLLLKDEDCSVKVKAAEALGYIYGDF